MLSSECAEMKWIKSIYFISLRLPDWKARRTDGHVDGERGAVQQDFTAETLQWNNSGRLWKFAQLPRRPDCCGEWMHKETRSRSTIHMSHDTWGGYICFHNLELIEMQTSDNL